MRVIRFKYCKKCMRSQIKKFLTFFGRIYGHVRLNISILVIGFKYMPGYCNALDIWYVFR